MVVYAILSQLIFIMLTFKLSIMSITVIGCSGNSYEFEGPYDNTDQLENKSGVYFILCLISGKYYPIDVGESAMVKERVENHDRKDCWTRNCNGELVVAVYYSSYGRMEVEEDIRCNYNLPCGER